MLLTKKNIFNFAKNILIMRTILFSFLTFLCLSSFAQVPQDSVGIFAIENGKYVRMNKICYSKIKTSGGLAAAFSFGLAKVKAKYEYKGNTSIHKFKGLAKFRICFGIPRPEHATNLYMFTTPYSIENFEVAKFEVKKNKRLLTGVTVSILGSSVGVSGEEGLIINNKEISPGVYDFTVQGRPGEYCVIFTPNGTGVYNGVFDFTIE